MSPVQSLHQMKIKVETGAGRLTEPTNFSHRNLPYGYRVFQNKLLVNRKEIKICRAVVNSIGWEVDNIRETGRDLIKRGYKNRRGDLSWGHYVITQIYNSWKDKV